MFFDQKYEPLDTVAFEKTKQNIPDEAKRILSDHNIDIDDVVDRKFGFISWSRLKSHENYDTLSDSDLLIMFEMSLKLEEDMLSFLERLDEFKKDECEKLPFISEVLAPTFMNDRSLPRLLSDKKSQIQYFEDEIKKLK